MSILINSNVKEILNKINNEGYEAYLVGGAVRDTILGIQNKDYDICTNMPLNKVKELFPPFVIMKPNNRRNTGIMKINGNEIEISEFKGHNIFEDLNSRDFTINAVALDTEGHIIDTCNGIESIKKGKISLIDQTGAALEADPLRILRGIRLAAKMNFEIDKNCLAKMEKNKRLLKDIHMERIYKELKIILLTDNPAQYIRKYKNIFFEILPELAQLEKTPNLDLYHSNNLFEHTLKVLENTQNNIFLRLAVLFHAIGRINCSSETYPKESLEIFDEISNRLKMDKKTKKEVGRLIGYHNYHLTTTQESIFEFVKNYGVENIDLLFALKKAAIMAQNPKYLYRLEELEHIEKICVTIANTNPCLSVRKLMINPKMLLKRGIPKNKLRKTQKEILFQVVFNNLPNNKESLEQYIAKKLI